MHELESWARKNLRPCDKVVIEAGPNSWFVHDCLEPLCAEVVVADSRRLRAMVAGAPKTDQRDALAPARFLAAGIVPEIWVPPPAVRELRGLIRYRSRLVRRSTAARNRLHAVLTRRRVLPPPGDPFGAGSRSWWEGLPGSSTEHLRVRQDLDTLEFTREQLCELEAELSRLSVTEIWREPATLLMQLPGFAVVNTMTFLAAVGTIDRFPGPDQLVGYSGLCPRIRQSGETLRSGRISKAGRRELRTAMVQAAWAAVRSDRRWRRRFERLRSRMPAGKAITAIARMLLVLAWHVLTRREADRYRDPGATAQKMLRWASEHHLATAAGLSRAEFVQQRLDALRLSHVTVTVGGARRLRIASTRPPSSRRSREPSPTPAPGRS
jgi:transposase